MKENLLIPVKLSDGLIVETVFYGSGTLCISSQAGCRMNCPYCASGSGGFVRNLTAAEMWAQVDANTDADIERVTVSGIGEPMENFDTVKAFIDASDAPVSLTTSVPDSVKLSELISLKHNGLMLSIHAGLEPTRRKLSPKGAPLGDIKMELAGIWKSISNNKKRKIGFNYLLFEGVNDSSEEIESFIDFALNFKESTVHLLLCNDVSGSRFRSPPPEEMNIVYNHMRDSGLNVRRANNWRKSRNGGCGTLFIKNTKNNVDL